ncbi:MAG: ketoacyl-ACP synthase III [Candidatus Cloacimonas acidaminovorans]|jgi:3-oxoacyl-[acyl-carrier-protein] synthase-3|nr:ketoacyl-ACP synthase III [Candidatus Cloacimonas acidaminovorans]
MGARIKQVEYYLPEGILTNEELEKAYPEWSAAKLEKKVGIKQRHIAGSEETSLDLANNAAKKIFEKEDKDLIDFVLFCTQSPDYLLPTSACLLQARLGLKKEIGALDFNLGCSGYVYGLAIAKGLINSGICKNVLLLTGETYSKFIAEDDISNRSIFGDAGTATIITYSDENMLGEFVFGTDGNGAENLIVKGFSARNSYILKDQEKPTLYMNGPEIFNFTIETIPPLLQNVIVKNNLQLTDIDYFILHQANKYILEFLISEIGLENSKCHIDMLNYGNTVSNTIPIALKDSLDQSKINNGDKVLLAGFGVGYSWGSTIITI